MDEMPATRASADVEPSEWLRTLTSGGAEQDAADALLATAYGHVDNDLARRS